MASLTPDDPSVVTALSSIITPSLVKTLKEDGFIIVDNAFPLDLADRLREEIIELHAMGLMEQNQVHFAGRLYGKPHIFEGDLHHDVRRAACPFLGKIWSKGAGDLASTLTCEEPNFALPGTSKDLVVKLQINEGGGGCFPWHYDNVGRPNKRRVTMLCYLNPDWKEGDGGELLLLPFLRPAPLAERIAPLHNRIVFFLSDRICHRVLPAEKLRVAFTIWLDAEDGKVNSDDDVLLKAKHLAWNADESEDGNENDGETLPPGPSFLTTSPLQRSLSRAVYAEAYEASLRECMSCDEGEGRAQALEGLSAMLAEHEHAVKQASAHPLLGKWVKDARLYMEKVMDRSCGAVDCAVVGGAVAAGVGGGVDGGVGGGAVAAVDGVGVNDVADSLRNDSKDLESKRTA
eukprot:TRINITY_DN2276_c1_g8_i1.p1 TRINITY_DN2276_c1_g8~~TRINITY_DN2276_c1_g8_i1.p1  ORF type:complete len:413 (-),score=94.68 TRINITY_DN2276_c1_g8_i1:22-1230(-)